MRSWELKGLIKLYTLGIRLGKIWVTKDLWNIFLWAFSLLYTKNISIFIFHVSQRRAMFLKKQKMKMKSKSNALIGYEVFVTHLGNLFKSL